MWHLISAQPVLGVDFGIDMELDVVNIEALGSGVAVLARARKINVSELFQFKRAAFRGNA
jgi:hypothetical protein